MPVASGTHPIEPAALDAWQRFQRTRDPELRHELIEQHLPLARTLAAMTYSRRGGLAMEFGDYLQLATLGLIESVDRYDPDGGASFATFATLRIRGAILNGLEGLSEQYQQLGLYKRLRRERMESLSESASAAPAGTGFTALADIAVGLALSNMLEGSGMLLPDAVQAPSYQHEFYDNTLERQARETLNQLVHALPEQERRVIRYHYYQRLQFSEIAELFGVGRSRISQIHRQALQLLRQARGGGASLDLYT